MKDKLNVGVLLNDYQIPAWEYKILEKVIHSDFAVITLVVKNDSNVALVIKKKKTAGIAILKLHERIDKLIFKNNPDYNVKKNSYNLLKDVSEIVVRPVAEGSVYRFTGEELSEIKTYKLDVVLDFGFGLLGGDILKIPKYGVWTYTMDDFRNFSSVSSGYWEIVKKTPVTASSLEILKEDSENGITISHAYESTYRYSININRNRLFWRASLFAPRVINGIYKYGDSYLTRLIDKFKKEEQANIANSFEVPFFIPVLRNFLFSIVVTIQQTCKKLFYSDSFNWILLFEMNKVEDVLQNSFPNFKKLKPPQDKFWADPFVISKDSKYYVFVEEFIYKTDKGHISLIELDDTGNFLGSERIIERPYHMSYPFIFELNDNYYMIPESSQNKSIELYRCEDFPYKWEFTKNLMENLTAVDTTLFFHEKKWWLFTSIDGTDGVSGGSTELFLYFSDDLFSDKWESHPWNPIVSDVRTARPAGRIFIQDNKIYRPSQDCAVRYGKGFNLNQITTLTETEYDEKLLLKVEPEWDSKLKGSHTFNFDNNITVIDAYSYRRRF